MASRLDLTRNELADVLAGEPSYRTGQVWRGLHQGLEPGEMTELPKALRQRLEGALPPGLSLAATSTSDGGDTVKWLWSLGGGAAVETVLMHYADRTTVCVSTQAGCAMACSFCATGQAGFRRHLTAGEIVEQVVRARRAARPRRLSQRPEGNHLGPSGSKSRGRRKQEGPGGSLSSLNVVFMGMGEPLANYGPTWAAVERLHEELGISARHLTVSTVGLVPGILRLAGERLPVNLAVSLHAANDELRDSLVPVNRRWPLPALLDACRTYLEAKGRRLSFEWALIDGVNDRAKDADELAALVRPLGAHVNLIPLNPTPGYPTRGTPPTGVQTFRNRLRALGVNATVRRNRGTDIDAACGQLAGAALPAREKTPR